MSSKNKKQFAVWMDSHHATVMGRENIDRGNFIVLGHIENKVQDPALSEKATNNAEQGAQLKFFKEISALMQNAEELHVTGTGVAQEQFIHYMADTPQFKNTIAKDSTSNKMSEEKLIEFISEQFHHQLA